MQRYGISERNPKDMKKNKIGHFSILPTAYNHNSPLHQEAGCRITIKTLKTESSKHITYVSRFVHSVFARRPRF